MPINGVRGPRPRSIHAGGRDPNPQLAAEVMVAAAEALKVRFPGVTQVEVTLPQDPLRDAPAMSWVRWLARGQLNGRTVALSGNYNANRA